MILYIRKSCRPSAVSYQLKAKGKVKRNSSARPCRPLSPALSPAGEREERQISLNRCISHPATGGMGGFSTLFRPALKHGGVGFVRRARSSIYATEGIRGKTGPLPKGALLFGPFSSAHKKKDVNKIKIRIYQKKSDLQMTNPFLPFCSKSCVRRVPFEATKRNQKSPLGAGPATCMARIPSQDSPHTAACQLRRISQIGAGVSSFNASRIFLFPSSFFLLPSLCL